MKINFYNETEESVFKYERLINSNDNVSFLIISANLSNVSLIISSPL